MNSLSIVIPVFNVAPYLERCLDSVLVDNYFTGEVICVNDGSTDNGLSILEEYANRYDNIRIISQVNAGLSAARNAGLDAASGDYVFFLDSDDWIFEGKLDQVLARVNGEDVLYFNATRYFEDSHSFEPICDIPEMRNLSGAAYFAAAEEQKRNMPLVCVWGGFYKRSFLLDNNLYNEPGIYHEDSYFTPQVLLKANNVSCVNICLYAYRIRQGSITTTVRKKHIEDMLYVCRQLNRLFDETPNVSDVFRKFVANYYITTLIEAFANNISMRELWRFNDSNIMVKYINAGYSKRIAKLTYISPKLAYLFGQDKLPIYVRKLINRVL